MTEKKSLEELFGPKLTKALEIKMQQLDPQPHTIVCNFCSQVEAIYKLEAIRVLLITPDKARHMVESKPTRLIATCLKHHCFDTDEYLAGAVHLTIMQETSVPSEMEDFEVMWKML